MRLLLALPALLLVPAVHAGASSSPLAGLRRERLENGLTVLLLEDHRAPLVSLGAMYAVGARNEAAGHTGIAHFVEHMNFRATARFPGSENTGSITRMGGRWSGYTWIDQTYYGATAPREALGLLLDIEADRMSAARFLPEEFDRERGSVIAELHSYDDPHSLLYDAVLAASFELHPYRHNTIGWLSDVEQITRDEAWRFYRRFYHPGNAVLAVVGDFDGARVMDEVRRRFGALPKGEETGAVRTVEPPQAGQRRVAVRRPGPHAEVLLAWRAPALGESDFAAMVLFDALLAGGKGFEFTRDYPAPADAPLPRALAAAGATRASSDWQASRYPYVYTLLAATADARGLEAAETALWRVLEAAAQREWSEGELQAARRQAATGWAGDLDDLAGRAHQLAFFEVSGGAAFLEDMPALLERVSADDVRRFGRERLRPEQATVGWFVPVDEAPASAPPAGPAPAPPRARSAPPSPAGAEPPPLHAETLALGNGVRAHLRAGVGAGLVALRARLDAGPRHDASGTGLAALLVERLGRKSPDEPAGAPALTFTLHEEPAAPANVRWIELAGECLPEELPALLALLAHRLERAAEPVALAEWKALLDAASERAREHAESSVTGAWARALAELHPPGSPAALPAWSTEAALSHAAPGALHGFARDRVRPERLHVAVAGALDASEARRLLEASLGRWRAAAAPLPAARKAAPAEARGEARWREMSLPDAGQAQNDVLVVWPGERATAADRAATRALLYLLGETDYAGRLGRALVETGLVYSVRASLESDGGGGLLAIRTAAGRAHTRAVLDRIRAIVEEAARGGFTQAELDEAKAYLRGRDVLRRQGARAAAQAALEEATEPAAADPQALTLAQLNAAARKLLARGAPLALVAGPGLE